MNILLTSIGRRTYLIDYFKNVLQNNGTVYCTNSTKNAAGIACCDDHFIVPHANDKSFIPSILSICELHNIDLLFSLHDLEAPIIAQHRELFVEKNVFPVISSPEILDICLDKLKNFDFCIKNNIHFPQTFTDLNTVTSLLNKGSLSFPLIVKPRHGFGSLGLSTAHNIDEMNMLYTLIKNEILRSQIPSFIDTANNDLVIIQPKIRGNEYGIDIINDLSGEHVTCLIKRKIAMRSGETDIAVTEYSETAYCAAEKLGQTLKHIGILDADLIIDDQGTPFFIDLNPRFGGGYPFSHCAGADIPAYLISIYNETLIRNEWLELKNGVTSMKNISMITL